MPQTPAINVGTTAPLVGVMQASEVVLHECVDIGYLCFPLHEDLTFEEEEGGGRQDENDTRTISLASLYADQATCTTARHPVSLPPFYPRLPLDHSRTSMLDVASATPRPLEDPMLEADTEDDVTGQESSGAMRKFCLEVSLDSAAENARVTPLHRRLFLPLPEKRPPAERKRELQRRLAATASSASTAAGAPSTLNNHPNNQYGASERTMSSSFVAPPSSTATLSAEELKKLEATRSRALSKVLDEEWSAMYKISCEMREQEESFNQRTLPRVRNPLSRHYYLDARLPFLERTRTYLPSGEDEQTVCRELHQRARDTRMEVHKRRLLMNVVLTLQTWLWEYLGKTPTDQSASLDGPFGTRLTTQGQKCCQQINQRALAWYGASPLFSHQRSASASEMLSPPSPSPPAVPKFSSSSSRSKRPRLEKNHSVAPTPGDTPPAHLRDAQRAMLCYLWTLVREPCAIIDLPSAPTNTTHPCPLRMLVACCWVLAQVDELDTDEFQLRICLHDVLRNMHKRKDAAETVPWQAELKYIRTKWCDALDAGKCVDPTTGSSEAPPAPLPIPDPWALPRNLSLVSTPSADPGASAWLGSAELWYMDSPVDGSEFNMEKDQRQAEFLRFLPKDATLVAEGLWSSSAHWCCSRVLRDNATSFSVAQSWMHLRDQQFGGACSMLSLARTGGFRNPISMTDSCRDWCAAQCVSECRPSCLRLKLCCKHMRTHLLRQALCDVEKGDVLAPVPSLPSPDAPTLVHQWICSLPLQVREELLLNGNEDGSRAGNFFLTRAVQLVHAFTRTRVEEFEDEHLGLDEPLAGKQTLPVLSPATKAWLLWMWAQAQAIPSRAVGDCLRLLPHVRKALAHCLATEKRASQDTPNDAAAPKPGRKRASHATDKRRKKTLSGDHHDDNDDNATDDNPPPPAHEPTQAQRVAAIRTTFQTMWVDPSLVLWYRDPVRSEAFHDNPMESLLWFSYLRLRGANPSFRPFACKHPSTLGLRDWRRLEETHTFVGIALHVTAPRETCYPDLHLVGIDTETLDEEDEAGAFEILHPSLSFQSSSSGRMLVPPESLAQNQETDAFEFTRVLADGTKQRVEAHMLVRMDWELAAADEGGPLPSSPLESVAHARDVRDRLLRYLAVRTVSNDSVPPESAQARIQDRDESGVQWRDAYFLTNWVRTSCSVEDVVQFVFPARAIPAHGRIGETFRTFVTQLESASAQAQRKAMLQEKRAPSS